MRLGIKRGRGGGGRRARQKDIQTLMETDSSH